MEPLVLRIDDKLELRLVDEDDAEELAALVDRNRAYLKEWLPWLDSSTSIEDTARFIGRSLEQAEDDNGLTYGMRYEGRLAGIIGEHYVDHLNRKTEMGYWLDAGHQGQGIVTRATARFVNLAFEEQDCNKVILHCAVENTKSRAIPERLGFRQEGILREAEWLYDRYVDLVVYSILKREWSFGDKNKFLSPK